MLAEIQPVTGGSINEAPRISVIMAAALIARGSIRSEAIMPWHTALVDYLQP